MKLWTTKQTEDPRLVAVCNEEGIPVAHLSPASAQDVINVINARILEGRTS